MAQADCPMLEPHVFASDNFLGPDIGLPTLWGDQARNYLEAL